MTATADEEKTPISFHPPTPFDFHAPHIYPSKTRSLLLSLKNLWLPFHNRRFAVFLGLIYVVYAWVFQIAITDPGELTRRSQAVAIEQICARHYPSGEFKKDNKAFEDCKQKLSPAIETSTFRKRVTELERHAAERAQAASGTSCARARGLGRAGGQDGGAQDCGGRTEAGDAHPRRAPDATPGIEREDRRGSKGG